MNNNSSRDKILKRISEAKQTREFGSVFSVSPDDEIYKPIEPNAVTCFKRELEAINGQCELSETKDELLCLGCDYEDHITQFEEGRG